MNPWKSQLFKNGTITNATHFFHTGQYILSGCPTYLDYIFEEPAMENMTNREMIDNEVELDLESSGSGSDSGSGYESGFGMSPFQTNVSNSSNLTPYIDPYPVWLGGCLIRL